MSDESEEKTDEPSDRKLEKLREKGIVASAPTASDHAGFAAGLLMTAFLLPFMISRLMGALDEAFVALNAGDPTEGLRTLEYYLITINTPLLAILVAVAVGAAMFRIATQGGFLFAMDRVVPKLQNLDPIEGTKKLFKGAALTDFLASLFRFTVVLAVVGLLAVVWGPTLLKLDVCVPTCAWPVARSVILWVVLTVLALILVTFVFDTIVHRIFFLIEQRMTKTEVKRERKEMLGTPEIKQARKRIGREIMETGGYVGRSRATIYFHDRDQIVAFAFHPVQIPLPRIAAKASGPAAAVLRRELVELGVPSRHSPVIVAASIRQPLGAPAPREIFLELAQSLRDVLS